MLVRNTMNLAQMPLRHLGGGTLSGSRTCWGRTSMRNMTLGDGLPNAQAGIPHGGYSPSVWLLPYEGGAISTRVGPTVTFTPTGALAEGRQISGTAAITFTGAAALSLVVSGSGVASLSFTASGSIVGAAAGSGTASVAFSVSGAAIGTATMTGVAATSFTNTGALSGIGYMSGLSSPGVADPLTAESIADAVWSKVLP